MLYRTPDKVECVIFDWAGTIVDFGSFAPTQIFVEAFAAFGVPVTLAEARGPMGIGKWDQIRALCDDPAIAQRYEARHGRLPTDDDVTAIYNRFLPLQIEKIGVYSAMIPGALDVISALRHQKIRIGSCSGYPRAVMDKVEELARSNGFVADCVVAADEVPKGRPYPSQSLTNAVALGVEDVAACVKVDDTVPGIFEGRRAGMWTVALLMSGNALGLDFEQYTALPEREKDSERGRIQGIFADSKPHYMIDTIADLPGVTAHITSRLSRGETPQGN